MTKLQALSAHMQPGRARCVRVVTLQALPCRASATAECSSLPVTSHPEEDQRRLRAAQAGRWTSGALRRPLPVRQRAPGPQPSGVNLSDCQAKYCKSLAITETVKGQMQFPALFTQLEAPNPAPNCQEWAELRWAFKFIQNSARESRETKVHVQ